MFELEHSMKIFESFLWKCYIFYLSFSWRFFFSLDEPLCQPHTFWMQSILCVAFLFYRIILPWIDTAMKVVWFNVVSAPSFLVGFFVAFSGGNPFS